MHITKSSTHQQNSVLKFAEHEIIHCSKGLIYKKKTAEFKNRETPWEIQEQPVRLFSVTICFKNDVYNVVTITGKCYNVMFYFFNWNYLIQMIFFLARWRTAKLIIQMLPIYFLNCDILKNSDINCFLFDIFVKPKCTKIINHRQLTNSKTIFIQNVI